MTSNYRRVELALSNLGLHQLYFAKFQENEFDDEAMDKALDKQFSDSSEYSDGLKEIVAKVGPRVNFKVEFKRVTVTAAISTSTNCNDHQGRDRDHDHDLDLPPRTSIVVVDSPSPRTNPGTQTQCQEIGVLSSSPSPPNPLPMPLTPTPAPARPNPTTQQILSDLSKNMSETTPESLNGPPAVTPTPTPTTGRGRGPPNSRAWTWSNVSLDPLAETGCDDRGFGKENNFLDLDSSHRQSESESSASAGAAAVATGDQIRVPWKGPPSVDCRDSRLPHSHNFDFEEHTGFHIGAEPCYVYVNLFDESKSHLGYRIGKFRLKLCPDLTWETFSLDSTKIRDSFPHLRQVILFVQKRPALSTVLVKIERFPGAKAEDEEMNRSLLGKRKQSGSKVKTQRTCSSSSFKHFYYYFVPVDIPENFFGFGGLGSKKTFELQLLCHDTATNEVTIGVNLLASAIVGDHKLIDERPERNRKLLRDIFDHFFSVNPCGRNYEEYVVQDKEDLDRFYAEIKKYHNSQRLRKPKISAQHSSLIPTLKNYQRDAVEWMLRREGEAGLGLDDSGQATLSSNGSTSTSSSTNSLGDLVSNFYIPVDLKSSCGSSEVARVFYNHFIGFVSWVEPPPPKLPTGGILADEMGLGKTVEMLSLILCHRLPSGSGSTADIRLSAQQVLDRIQAELLASSSRAKGRSHSTTNTTTTRSTTQPKYKKRRSNSPCVFTTTKSSEGINPEPKTSIQSGSQEFVEDSTSSSETESELTQTGTGRGLMTIKATLIVSPYTIVHQWIEEIQRHIQNEHFKILLYKGAGKHGDEVTASKLADYDIVLTTYGVLRKELNFVPLSEAFTQSVLVQVKWWRICLDEAQMVEGICTKMSLMARELRAVHRWCVTGTPINKTLKDLFGLFTFLRVEPICVKGFWDMMVNKPFCNGDMSSLSKLLGQFLWRNSKTDVQNELDLSRPTEIHHWLNFKPDEKRAYNMTYLAYKENFLANIARLTKKSPNFLNMPLTALDRQAAKSIFQPLLALRKSCCHAGDDTDLRGFQKTTLTFAETCERQIKLNRDSFLEAQHNALSHLNARADAQQLKKNFAGAASTYKDVLTTFDMAEGIHNVKSLQVFHALVQLQIILSQNNEGSHDSSPPSPFGETMKELPNQISQLRKDYKARHGAQAQLAQDQVTPISLEIQNHIALVCPDNDGQASVRTVPWWVLALKRAQEHRPEDCQLLAIIEDGVEFGRGHKSMNRQVPLKTVEGVESVLTQGFSKLTRARDNLLANLRNFLLKDPETLLKPSKLCHIRQAYPLQCICSRCLTVRKCKVCSPKDRVGSVRCKSCVKLARPRSCTSFVKCSLCAWVESGLNQYEKLLYWDHMLTYIVQHDTGTNRASRQLKLEEEIEKPWWVQDFLDQTTCFPRKDSVLEQVCLAVLRLATRNDYPRAILDQGAIHVQLFAKLKTEFWHLAGIVQNIFNNVSALYELEVAPDIVGKRKASAAEAYYDREESKRLSRFETENEKCNVFKRQFENWQKLRTRKTDILATWNLCKVESCRNTSSTQKCFLPCGHFFCFEMCLRSFCPTNHVKFLCPCCQGSKKFKDISFAVERNAAQMDGQLTRLRVEGEADERLVAVVGEFSSKVEGVVRELLNLAQTHPGEKVVLFCEWNSILDLIATALDQNGIKCSVLLGTEAAFQKQIRRFKEVDEVQVLLMLLGSGSKGLNIVEASHVFLAAPSFNLASELQAIGRIDRIGQTRPTYVHRFYVRGTIEEELFRVLQKRESVSSSDDLLVKDLCTMIDPTNYT